VDGTGSGSCPVAGFGISSVEPWSPATTMLVHRGTCTEELRQNVITSNQDVIILQSDDMYFDL